MNDKKNIDRLFQEKFKNFEVTPDDAVWKKIQARKTKDRKRTVIIPFWYRIAGVAAAIAIIFSLGSILFGDTTGQNPIVVTENSEENQNDTISNDRFVNNATNQKANDTDGASKSINKNNDAITNNDVIGKEKKDSFLKTPKGQKYIIPNSSKNFNSEGSIVKTENNTKKLISNSENKEDIILKEKTSTKNAVTTVGKKDLFPSNANKNSLANSNTLPKNEASENDTDKNSVKKENSYFTNPTKNNNSEAIANTKTTDNSENENAVIKENSDQNQDSGKKSIFDVIKNKEKEEVAIAKTEVGKRWDIAPNVAPIYYDSFSGSSIDSEFSDNTKQGEVNLSYGIQVTYAIDKRLSVRSGVSKVDVGYNTDNVGFGVPAIGRAVSVSSISGSGSNVQNVIISDYQDPSLEFSSGLDVNSEVLAKSQNRGILNHSIGYIEVPVELKYAVVDSKIGIHMIGGVSTLFLEDDTVSIIAGNFINENVERDDTVNDVSFSGNIGLGFDYKLSDQFQINMEPIFKYQFNGFKESADNFKPYYFGIYTGISFKF